MRAGMLDRYITIESASLAADSTGEMIPTWSTFAQVWAHRRDVRGDERLSGERDFAVRTATYRMRWLAGVHERMRIVEAGVTYLIRGISDHRRQGWMELFVEAIDPGVTA